MSVKWEDSLIVTDTREQHALFEDSERVTLKTGDMSVRGYEARVAVERKSIADLLGSLGGRKGIRRARFEACFDRLSRIERRAVVIEGSISAIYKAPRFGRITPSMAIGTMLSWEQKYRVPVHFSEDRVQARGIVKTILRQAWESFQKEGADVREAT